MNALQGAKEWLVLFPPGKILLPTFGLGLSLEIVKAALIRGRTDDDGAINRWLIEMFSA